MSYGPRQIPGSACLIRLYSDCLHAGYADFSQRLGFVNLWAEPDDTPIALDTDDLSQCL